MHFYATSAQVGSAGMNILWEYREKSIEDAPLILPLMLPGSSNIRWCAFLFGLYLPAIYRQSLLQAWRWDCPNSSVLDLTPGQGNSSGADSNPLLLSPLNESGRAKNVAAGM